MSDTIRDYEERLRQAMLANDLAALDELIADDLVFVTHFGAIITKADDLDPEQRSMFSLTRLDFLEQTLRTIGDATVAVTVCRLQGRWGDTPVDDTLVYTRVWRRDGDGRWRVAAGQATRRPE